MAFLVKSMYLDFINNGSLSKSPHICNTKIPLKIKVFMWFVHKEVILSKDNLAKRSWVGSKRSSFLSNNI